MFDLKHGQLAVELVRADTNQGQALPKHTYWFVLIHKMKFDPQQIYQQQVTQSKYTWS
jgi:hypothetical protein